MKLDDYLISIWCMKPKTLFDQNLKPSNFNRWNILVNIVNSSMQYEDSSQINIKSHCYHQKTIEIISLFFTNELF